jgi:arylsulfatase A-like enzyme
MTSNAALANPRLNVVFFLVDNLGIGELSVYNAGSAARGATPRIDAFAWEGMRLLNFAPETQCTPSVPLGADDRAVLHSLG